MNEHSQTEMEKAEALITALRLLHATHKDHIWVYALRKMLQATPMTLCHRESVSQLVRQHSQVVLAIGQLHAQHHLATTPPEGDHLYPPPSTTS